MLYNILKLFNKKNTFSFFVVVCICCGLLIQTDTVLFEKIEKKTPLKPEDVLASCAPSHIFDVIPTTSLGREWKLIHSLHCLGNPHVVSTSNVVGIESADKLISLAMIHTYVHHASEILDIKCKKEFDQVDPMVVEVDDRKFMFLVYVLQCEEI